jgi:thiosulfate/3-mercaptopyruvate sulfurtransferase
VGRRRLLRRLRSGHVRQPLVAADRLAAELACTAPPVLLDCRWQLAGSADRAAYDRGHLPGAAFVDLDRDLAAAPGPRGRHPLPDPTGFQAAMRRCGVDDGRPAVAYDQGDAGGAARAWWLLGFFGHPGTRVLDGGLPAWVAAGRPAVHASRTAATQAVAMSSPATSSISTESPTACSARTVDGQAAACVRRRSRSAP